MLTSDGLHYNSPLKSTIFHVCLLQMQACPLPPGVPEKNMFAGPPFMLFIKYLHICEVSTQNTISCCGGHNYQVDKHLVFKVIFRSRYSHYKSNRSFYLTAI